MIECQRTTDLSDARQIADLIRIRLRRPSILAQLNAAGLSVSKFGPTTLLEYAGSGHAVSRANLDVFLNAADQDIDNTLGSGDWIGEVIIDGKAGPTDPPIDVPIVVDALT